MYAGRSTGVLTDDKNREHLFTILLWKETPSPTEGGGTGAVTLVETSRLCKLRKGPAGVPGNREDAVL